MGHEVCRTGPNLQSWSLGFGSIMLSFSNSLLAFGIICCGQPDKTTNLSSRLLGYKLILPSVWWLECLQLSFKYKKYSCLGFQVLIPALYMLMYVLYKRCLSPHHSSLSQYDGMPGQQLFSGCHSSPDFL